jgi:hypothetical protein
VTGSLPTNGTPDGPGIAGSVAGEWVEVYPPDGAAPEPAEPEPVDTEPAPRIGPLASGLFGAALLLVLLGSILPLFRAVQRVSFRFAQSIDVGAWRFTTANQFAVPSQGRSTQSVPTPFPLGYPLVLAGLLVLAAAGLVLRAGWHPASLRPARLVGVIGATFLVGLVFALGMFEIAWRSVLDADALGGLVAAPGQGFWLLVVAAMVASAAAVLTFRVRPPEPVPAPDDQWGSNDVEPTGEVPPGQPAEWPVVAVIPADERSNW